MKIYTRTGDDGTTGVLGSERLLKSSLRVEAYGQVDELNAALGAVRALDAQGWLHAEIDSVQRLLFNVGAELATLSADALSRLPRVGDDDVAGLERAIDRLEADLPPLRNFVLPQGSPLAAELHVARAVCRRAERHVVALAQTEKAEPRLIRFLNRLADLLFVMARWCNQRAGIADTEWKAR